MPHSETSLYTRMVDKYIHSNSLTFYRFSHSRLMSLPMNLLRTSSLLTAFIMKYFKQLGFQLILIF